MKNCFFEPVFFSFTIVLVGHLGGIYSVCLWLEPSGWALSMLCWNDRTLQKSPPPTPRASIHVGRIKWRGLLHRFWIAKKIASITWSWSGLLICKHGCPRWAKRVVRVNFVTAVAPPGAVVCQGFHILRSHALLSNISCNHASNCCVKMQTQRLLCFSSSVQTC